MNWGVDFQAIHVHYLKFIPLTHIMVICAIFKEIDIDMGE
jgi:hypothetical protein